MSYDTIDLVPAYRGNPLIEACGPILSEQELFDGLVSMPEMPGDLRNIPYEVRRHMVAALWKLHVPSPMGLKLASNIGVMIRQGYVDYRPGTPEFWRRLYKNQFRASHSKAASVTGISGIGKSEAISRALHLYPQVVEHSALPGFVSPFKQLLWLKIDAPPSGKLVDLAENLMIALDLALGVEHFATTRIKSRKHGPSMFHEWLGVAIKNCLGFLVIDEIQNFFKQAPVRDRRRKHLIGGNTALRIVEDEALKRLLSITNEWGIPILLVGTPDGMEALATRMAVLQRAVSHGMYLFPLPDSSKDYYYSKTLVPVMSRYQWVTQKLPLTEGFVESMYASTAGVSRIITAGWIAAHWVAYEERRDELTPSDFSVGMQRYLNPLKPAVSALLSNDPTRLALYEDALPKDPVFWGSFQ